jgi:hypothetical protein
MEGLLAFVGFSVGASLGTAVVRGVGPVLRPLGVGAVQAGLALGDAARTGVSSLGNAVAGAAGTARENLSDITAEAKQERAAKSAGESQDVATRRIEVVQS